MQKKLTLISEINLFSPKSILCLVHEKNSEKEDAHYEFGYLTSSINYIRKESGENDFCVESSRSVYDLFENRMLNNPTFQGFNGEVFQVATIGSPEYLEYFQGILGNDYTIDFDKPLFDKDDKEYDVKIVDNRDDGFHYRISNKDSYYQPLVNNQGIDVNGKMIITNFLIKDISALFQMQEGYLIMAEQSGPVFVSKNAYTKMIEANQDITVIGLKSDERYKMHSVLNIMYDNVVIDSIILNVDITDSEISKNRLVFEKMNRPESSDNVEYEEFETNSDIWDNSFDNDDNYHSDSGNIFLKRAEELLGGKIVFEPDFDEPSQWDDDVASTNEWEESLDEELEMELDLPDPIFDADENRIEKNIDDWDDEIELDDEEDK